ncbi:MAG: hypothetical protein AB7P44_00970 [Steroidobacteraceae bacterium]
MKKILKFLGWSVAAIAAAAIVAFALASWVTSSRYGRQWTTHEATFPIPFPLTDAEIATIHDERIAGIDLQAVALERAIARISAVMP